MASLTLQVLAGGLLQRISGVSIGTLLQVPGLPPRLHDLQRPVQGVSQHTVSTQLLVWHSAPTAQFWPFGLSMAVSAGITMSAGAIAVSAGAIAVSAGAIAVSAGAIAVSGGD